jgi:aspartate/methionine/tyrosine aminotransferase
LVLQGLEAIGLPVPVRPDGAFYVYIDVSSTGLDAMQFCERSLDEAHVALTPGHDFGTSDAARYVRLSYAASKEDLQEGLTRLGRFMANTTTEASCP